MAGTLHSAYLSGGWYNFDGFAIEFSGKQGRIELVPSGLLSSVPLDGPDSQVALIVRVMAAKFAGETTVIINVPALDQLHNHLQLWDADGSVGIRWDPADNFGIRIEPQAGTRLWLVHCRLAESPRSALERSIGSLETAFELDRGCIESARKEVAAVIRCIRHEAESRTR
jgi:hypothetical protein